MAENAQAHLHLEGLSTQFIGRNILYYSSVTSTMDVARQAAQNRTPEGTAIVADQQTAGRGRLHRSWLSPMGGSLSVSLVLYPSMQQMPRLFMVAALAVARGIEKSTGLPTQLKWPNDVLINGKKVCGILIENELLGRTPKYAVIGMGINVNNDTSAHPEISGVATSLASQLGRPVDREDVLMRLLEEFETAYLALRNGTPVHQEWARCLITLGKRVQAASGDRVEAGFAESVDENGSLLLRRDDGSLVPIVAGDVTLRV